MKESLVYIILPVHNRKAVTQNFIEHLGKQTHANWHLVLIDDGSTDGTADMALSHFPGITVIRGKGDWWWGGSLHQGYLWLKRQTINKDDVVLIINDDVQFGADYLSSGVNYLHQHPASAVISYAYSLHSGLLLDKGVEINWKKLKFEPAADPSRINCLSTRGLFLRAEAFLKSGGFYPKMLPHYASDYEFTIRLARKGIKLDSSERIRLVANEKTTGMHNIINRSRWDYIKIVFSKKAAANPFYFSLFILLACPKRYIPVNILRIWRGFFSQLMNKQHS